MHVSLEKYAEFYIWFVDFDENEMDFNLEYPIYLEFHTNQH